MGHGRECGLHTESPEDLDFTFDFMILPDDKTRFRS